jgi:hypothetical protein
VKTAGPDEARREEAVREEVVALGPT